MALDSPHAKPSCKGAAYGDVPGWSRLKDVLHEKDIAPLGLLDVCLRLETGAERAAYMASPIGRIRRACRKYRLREGADAILTLRRVKVSLKNCTLITALLDPQIALEAKPDAVAPLLVKLDLRTASLDGGKLEKLARALPQNNILKELDLSGNNFEDGNRTKAVQRRYEADIVQDTGHGFRMAFGKKTIAEHVLSDEYTTKDDEDSLAANVGLKALGDALKTNTGLVSINLSESRVEANGLAALSQGLRRNASLTELKLARNMICDVSPQGWGAHSSRGVNALGEALSYNATLQKLDLSQNQLCGVTSPWCSGSKGTFAPGALLALRRPLSRNAALRELNLTDNGVLETARPLVDDLSGARLRGGGDFRLLERVGRAKRAYCILRRAEYYAEVAANARGESAY